jgi:hypothetical protein
MRPVGCVLATVLAVCAVSQPVRAQNPGLNVRVGGGVAKDITREACALKAIRVMEKEKFLFAEVDAKGRAWGYSEKASVLVIPFACPQGATFVLCTASSEVGEADRLRQVVCTHLSDDPADPKTPKQIGTPDPKAKAKVPVLGWQAEPHSGVSTLRFFDGGAAIVLEKQGLSVQQADKTLVMGGGQGAVAAAFLAPGSNALMINLGVLVASYDEATTSRLVSSLEQGIVKVLFE